MEEKEALDVKDYGAKGDGVTDDTEAMQRAIDAAGEGTVNVPEGVNLLNRQLDLSNRVRIIGCTFKGEQRGIYSG
jgi:polygalacturonase